MVEYTSDVVEKGSKQVKKLIKNKTRKNKIVKNKSRKHRKS